ncbi:hypothetical protein JTB14_028919 [Gonioctena quinquepunctata]|nr:hypothetical protein JTB14_028919 [Gonioctena quinquepunctata]
MNKKKSKCCCIFNKPREFGESSSEDSDDECDHCHGHVDKKKHKAPPNTSDCLDGGGTSTVEPNQTITVDN